MKKKIKKLIMLSMTTLVGFAAYSQEKLEIEGAIIIQNSEDATPTPGTIRWTDTDFEGWNGTEWVSLTKGQSGNIGRVSDIEGNEYQTITIGTQQWMTQNLRTTKYNDGTSIPKVTVDTVWGNLTSPGYCWYGNDSTMYADPYGALYNYYTVADTNSLNVCPTGWHIPTNAEWTALTTYLGSSAAGGKTKEAGLAHWASPNTGATNESGFTGLPGGTRGPSSGSFVLKGNLGFWWSSTELNDSEAWYRALQSVNVYLFGFYTDKRTGMSVRCVRD